jgi:hypothetical protein
MNLPGASVNRLATMPCRVVAVLSLFVLAMLHCSAASVMLEAVADTELRESAPTSVISGATIVAGGLGVHVGNETRRGLVRFNLTAIPARAVIVDARVVFNIERVPDDPGTSTFELRRLLVAWSEGQATWNNRTTGVAWQEPGALGGADVAAFPGGTAFVDTGTMDVESTSELVNDVQDWVRDPASNHGWLFRSQSEETIRTARHFSSREATVAANRPRLAVTFNVPPAIEAPAFENGELVFQFTAAAGATYAVQSRESVVSGDWEADESFGPFAEEQTVTFQAPVSAGDGQRFYRVAEE